MITHSYQFSTLNKNKNHVILSLLVPRTFYDDRSSWQISIWREFLRIEYGSSCGIINSSKALAFRFQLLSLSLRSKVECYEIFMRMLIRRL